MYYQLSCKYKYKMSSLEKYGADHYSQTEEFKEIVKLKRESLTKLSYENLISDEYKIILYKGINNKDFFENKCKI